MTIALAAVLDTPAAGPLRLALKQTLAEGGPLLLDGAAVERAGLACLQVLAAGRAAAGQRGLEFRIADASAPFAAMATLAGLDILVTA
jgi:chemotaxis protein CheX